MACGGQEAVQPTSTPTAGEAPTLDVGQETVQPTSTPTAREAPTLDIGREAVQPTSTPTTGEAPTLDIGREAVQPTSILTAGEAPTLDIQATPQPKAPPTTASGPSVTPDVTPPGSGIRGEIIYQGEDKGALAIVVWKGQPRQGEPTRFLPLDGPGAFSISPLDPDRYSVGAILFVGRNMPGIPAPTI